MKAYVLQKEEDQERQLQTKEQIGNTLENELNFIQDKFCLNFISDIHDIRYRAQILQYLGQLDIDKFPLVIWEKLLMYLTYQNLEFYNLEEVRAYLLKERKKMEWHRKE